MNAKAVRMPAGTMPALKVAALSRNPETLKNLRDYLATDDASIQLQIWPAEATHLPAMLEQEQPGLLLLETAGAREEELQGLEQLMRQHHDMAVVLICTHQAPEFLLRAMRIGVREVMPAPIDRGQLQQAVERIRERVTWHKSPRRSGRVLAFLPSKGGSGSTFFSTNLAYALGAEGKRVGVIDLNLHFGDAALYVSETAPTTTVADLVGQIQRLDSILLQSSMMHVTPNVSLLAAPDSPEKAVDIRPEAIERLIGVARGSFDFVILDLSRTLDANTIKALDCADSIYLVLQLTLPFIRDASRLLQLFNSLGYGKDRVRLLANRYEKESEITLEDVEKALGIAVSRTIPNSYRTAAESVNHGRPILDLAPRDPVARVLREMAAELTPAEQKQGGWWQRLIGRAA